MKRVELIMNPAAGKGQLLDLLDTITERLQEHIEDVRVYQTTKPGDGAARVKEIGTDTDLIIAAGGDGTVHELVNAVSALEKRPVFAILPGGTCNDFSRALGLSQEPLDALDQILAMRTKVVDVGCSSQGRYFLNFWGIGLITQVSLDITSQDKQRLGRLAYYFSAIQNLWEARPFHLKVETEEGPLFDGKAAMMVVGNGSFIGGVQGFFPQSRLDDGHFDLLIVKEATLEGAWSMLVSNMTKEWPESENLLYSHAASVSITASPPQEIDCDGEKGEFTPVELTALRNHLTMVVGQMPPNP
ncbi:diacylglycerol/lipid kinase family protein [Salinithrix halophila]|uniref:Diacylglycerol/lipid kinase family protein n=1 Tax=Salinithrix halophila TaxID=1485204 RepID=A0ABV8JEH5_9BACL